MARHLTESEFMAATPSVPAERIECATCGEEFIGGPESGPDCPLCGPGGVA